MCSRSTGSRGSLDADVAVTREGGPIVTSNEVTFRVPDPDRRLSGVKLYQEIARPRLGPPFRFHVSEDAWILDLPRPDASRIEYLLELEHLNGDTELITDPYNKHRVGGPFGDKSEVRLPGYEVPEWLGADAPAGRIEHLQVRSRPLRARLPVILWSPPDTDPNAPLPLLFVHDGPEYRSHSFLTHFLEVMASDGKIPPLRAALIGPADRNNSYSASAAYARSLAHEIMPAIIDAAPTPHGRSMRAGMGASLGALSMLHAHRRNPASFGGMFLQSGSYFRQRYDPQESGFPRFRRISRFVGEVLSAETWAHPIRITFTCGSIEENLANNRAMCAALERQDYEIELRVNRDGHNWTGWRDTFDPHLADFLRGLWG